MHRWGMAAAACLLAALAVAGPAAAATATDEMVSCAALGPKRPGSAADRTMGDVLLDRFRKAGLQTSAEDFHMPVWKPESTSLSIADGPGKDTGVPAQSFAYSGTGHVRAEVVDAGSGMPSDYDGKDVRGKLVLVDNGGSYHRTVQVEQIIARGGVGMIYVSATPKNLIQTGAVRWGQRPPAQIPAVSIGSQTGAALREQMKAGTVTLDLDVKGERVDAQTRNIVGVRKGTTYPDRYIVVAGHYDSWYAGANDNCSSVGTLLSVVAANKDVAPAYTMIYLGWGAEEPGLVGSYTWIAQHQDLIPKVVLNINLEETATATFQNGEPTALPSPTLTMGSTSPAMVGLATAAAASNVVLPPVVTPLVAARQASGGIIATDIEGFYAQGVQGISTASSSPYYHTTGDTSDTINLSDLERVTSYITDLTHSAQDVPPDGFTFREVPTVKVSAPARAAPGAAVPVEVTVTSPTGDPISDDRVVVLADQRDNWAVAEGFAEPRGNGRYRYTLPPGVTDAGITRLRATTSTSGYLAHGFTAVDQTQGGLLPEASVCRSRRVISLHVGRRGVRSLRASASRGTLRVRRGAGRYALRLDLRRVERGTVTVRLVARTRRGRVMQTRTYRTCVARA